MAEVTVGTLPSVDLIKLTHLAMKNKLQGLTLLGADNAAITVNATYSRPEEWVKSRIAPAINVNCFHGAFDPSRFSTDKLMAYVDESKVSMYTKQYPIPYKFFYEIRFITTLGQHSISLSEQILRRLPPMGFGAFLTVQYGTSPIELPFELVDDKDVFARFGQTTDNREFEHMFRYTVNGWLDTYTAGEESVVANIVVNTDLTT